MPQETISIRNFGGMMTNPHKEDIPDNMAVYAYNLDPQSELGVLKGIEVSGAAYQAEDPAVNIPDVYEADWINYDDSGTTKYDLVYIDKDDEDISAVENFYDATVANRLQTDLITSGIVPRCVKTFNNVAQIGCGVDDKAYAVNRLLAQKDFFNNQESVAAGLQIENGECYMPLSQDGYIKVYSAGGDSSGNGYFQNGILYRWATSLVYDGLQESNLVEGNSLNPATTSSKVAVSLKAFKLNNITLLDSRVTGVNLYRAESSDETVGNLGLYRLVKFIDINTGDDLSGTADAAVTVDATSLTDTRLNMIDDEYVGYVITCDGKSLIVTSNDETSFTGVSWFGGTPSSSGLAWTSNYGLWTDSSDDYIIAINDNGNFPAGGATYEENSGMPESLEFQSIRYAVNEAGGGYHWVSNGQPEGETDADWNRYIFRSKKFRPNMFDWTRDFLVLPEIPNALAWYNDRLYAFSENTTYRINPELLYIEDTYFGAGASHRQSVCVSEYGLYFCNLNGAYRIQDSGIEVISDPIAEVPRTENYIGWKAFALATAGANFDRVVIKAEVDKRLILFVGATASNASDCMAFYIPTGHWYRLGLGSAALAADSGLYSGKDGEVYISNATASYRLFAGATYETTSWISKEFHLDEPSQNKSWNLTRWDGTAGTGSISVFYGVEGALPSTAATSGAYINVYKKTFQVSIVTTGNALIDSIDILVRRLYGKR